MTEKIIVCQGVKGDLPQCANILKNIYNSNVLSEGWTQQTAEQWCEFWFKMQPDLFVAAKRKGEGRNGANLIGFACAYVKPWAGGNHLMIEEICVDPKYRKNGTALRILKELVSTAAEKYKVVKINGTTYEDENDMPFRIYKRMGFNKINDLFLIEADVDKVRAWTNWL